MHIRLAHYYYYEDLHIWLNEIVNIFLNGRLLSDAEKQTTLYFHLCIIDWQKTPEKINLFYWNEVVRIFIHGRLLHTWSRRKTDDITFPFMYTFSKEKNRRTLFYQLERVFWQLFAVFWRGPTLLEHFLSKREKVKKNRVGRSLAGELTGELTRHRFRQHCRTTNISVTGATNRAVTSVAHFFVVVGGFPAFFP